MTPLRTAVIGLLLGATLVEGYRTAEAWVEWRRTQRFRRLHEKIAAGQRLSQADVRWLLAVVRRLKERQS